NNQQNTPPNLICHTPLSTITRFSITSTLLFTRNMAKTRQREFSVRNSLKIIATKFSPCFKLIHQV
ncbi:hypothetical protein, partial [Legionella pneumophila]|uniref:hypothetical protein n=1 Tax=Legionella pneumophila TaxID=446 RepID=UPI001F42CB00